MSKILGLQMDPGKKGNVDKVRADREKKIKRISKDDAKNRRIDQELRDIVNGKMDPTDFNEDI